MFHMSQKDYKLEIIISLLQNNKHIRALARALETNQTTISRKIKELDEDNVLDFKPEGKNKVYFLKKTIEATEFAYASENYKLLKLIKKYPLLRNTIKKIKSNKKIKLALLFGSYAKGTANKNSDIDIYIETENPELKKEIQIINSKLSIKIGKYNKNNILIKEIEKNHIILKGVELFYEKSQFFN
jgi:predicted nucleotidyltransferase